MKRGTPPPSRRFGQNFLADERLAVALVNLFDPGPRDRIVEIGPGHGAMTRELAGRSGRLVALEIDGRLIQDLERALEPFATAEVRHADALETDWDRLAAELGGTLRVIGNLPYNVGTPIVRRLIASDAVSDIQVVLQLEVADRLLADAGGKDCGPLSIVVALRCRRERLRLLAPGCFRPRPKVTSCAVRLTRLADPPLAAAAIPHVERWLFAAFAQRRKTLANNLARHREIVQSFLVAHGLPGDARAEAVPAPLWLELALALDRAEAPGGAL